MKNVNQTSPVSPNDLKKSGQTLENSFDLDDFCEDHPSSPLCRGRSAKSIAFSRSESSGFFRSLKAYFLAARPRTLALSLSPVCIGASMVSAALDFSLLGFTLLFALFIQIGTNFANDYFDFIKGADTPNRIGPPRATASGWISPQAMLYATLITFLFACLFALPLMARAGLWSLPITALCVAFGVLYTGGPKPLGYLGWGEILVLIFFGPVPCCGAYYLQTLSWSPSVFIASLAPAFLSVSALVANNLRDLETDRVSQKKTLIVRFGRKFGSWEYALCILAAALSPILLFLSEHRGSALLLLLAFPTAIRAIRTAFYFRHPKELIYVLQSSARLLLLYTLLFCAIW